MHYDHQDPRNAARAREAFARLRDMVPGFVELGRLINPADTLEQAETGLPWHRLSNVEGVHLRRTLEGWHADVAFASMPACLSRVSVSPPSATKELAIQQTLSYLALCAEREAIPLPALRADGAVPFDIDGLTVFLPPWVLERAAAILADADVARDDAIKGLVAFRSETTGGAPITQAIHDAFDDRTRTRFASACAVALLLGVGCANHDDMPDEDTDLDEAPAMSP